MEGVVDVDASATAGGDRSTGRPKPAGAAGPGSGRVHVWNGARIAVAAQVVTRAARLNQYYLGRKYIWR